jgi:hypothetical protein
MVLQFDLPSAPLRPGYCAEANRQWIRKRQSEPRLQEDEAMPHFDDLDNPDLKDALKRI